MRPDFAKQLTERERIHHADHYHNYRHVKGPKGLTDDEVGGRESMRKRYNFGYDRKSFNENLNPLKSWVHSGLGKNWDKYYGQLRKQFDARKVINAHILEHLFQYVEIHTFVGEKGAVMFMDTRYTNKGVQPISKCYKDYYVCPRSGMLRKTHKEPRRSIVKQKEAEAQRKLDAVFRELDADTHLHLIDGVWYAFTLADLPEVEHRYEKPLGKDEFQPHYSGKTRTWDELNPSEKARFGVLKIIRGSVLDVLRNERVWRQLPYPGARPWGSKSAAASRAKTHYHYGHGLSRAPFGRYHASKATASHKQLKQAGLVK